MAAMMMKGEVAPAIYISSEKRGWSYGRRLETIMEEGSEKGYEFLGRRAFWVLPVLPVLPVLVSYFLLYRHVVA